MTMFGKANDEVHKTEINCQRRGNARNMYNVTKMCVCVCVI